MAAHLDILDLGIRTYAPVLALQEHLAAERRKDRTPDTLILVEHTPVFTLGRNAKPDHVVWNEVERARRGIELFEVGRGGDVTFHGPGQLVGYPIIKLEGAERRAVWYVSQLEQVLIRTLAAFGIQAGVDPCNRGVWVGPDKIAALGVRIAGHVTLHGFALNVAADLRYYEGIVPCGIRDRGVTSIHRFVPGVAMAEVKARLLDVFIKVFGYQTWKQVDYNDGS